MPRSRNLTALLALIALLSLAGCGGDEYSEPGSAGESPTEREESPGVGSSPSHEE